MLAGTSHAADEIIKTVTWPGGARVMTVEKVAICAVMAGAKPAYFPTILAVATNAPYGNSTTSMANTIIINGPIRNEIGVNYGSNAMGPYAEANATIGRSFTLVSKTVGGLHGPNAPGGKTTFSGLGSGLQYNNLCIGENEEMLPAGWDPLHVQLGYEVSDSVVTVGTGWTYISSVGEAQSAFPPQEWIADYASATTGWGGMCVYLDPSVARILSEVYGFSTKEMFSEYLSQNVEKTVKDYWQNGVVGTFNASNALQGLEPYHEWYTAWQTGNGDMIIKPFDNPQNLKVVVVGDGQTTFFVTDFRPSRGINIADWE
jgi:hypothetical protein